MMKRKLEFAAVVALAFVCTAAVLSWAIYGKSGAVSGESSVYVSSSILPGQGGKLFLMDRGLSLGSIDYLKIELEASDGDVEELEPIIVTAPRYVADREPGFIGEYRVTIRRGDKRKKVWIKYE